jgi:rod shape-determining protein MreD
LLVFAQAVEMAVRYFVSGAFQGWLTFVESAVAVILWPFITMILLAPQRRAVDKDHTRPI